MSIWDYWSDRAADKANLRLLVPGRGWVAYEDRNDPEGKITERGSKEGIESALINVLTASNFSTLTGAGASLCAHNDGDGKQAPSMSDLWEAVKNAVGENEFESICAKFPNAKISGNIEKLLSLCKIYLELHDSAPDEDDNVKSIKSFVLSAEMRILNLVDFVTRKTNLVSHESYVKKIGRRGFRKSRAKWFTTNYDLTIEESARRLRFTIIDGFSHSLDQVYDRQNFELDIVRRELSKDAPDYIPNVFQLYKLHGSADWRRVDGEVVRSRDNSSGIPVLIFPRSSKYQEAFEPPYLDMMGSFQAALRDQDVALIVAGFGFNDDHISRPIISALESNLSLRMIICDPCFIQSEDALRGAPVETPLHTIPVGQPPSNPFIAKITALAETGDPRLHLINGRFQDLSDALPDMVGETDRERHAERVRALHDIQVL